MQQARHRGEIVDTPKVSDVNPQSHSATLSKIFDKWRLEANPKTKTLAEWELVISRFNALHGVLKIDQITKAHIVAYKDARLRGGNAPATVTKQLGALSSLLQYSVGNDLLRTNVVAGVRVARSKVEKKARLPMRLMTFIRYFLVLFTQKANVRKGGRRSGLLAPTTCALHRWTLRRVGATPKKRYQAVG